MRAWRKEARSWEFSRELAEEAEELADRDPEFDDACEAVFLLGYDSTGAVAPRARALAGSDALWIFLRGRLRPLSEGELRRQLPTLS